MNPFDQFTVVSDYTVQVSAEVSTPVVASYNNNNNNHNDGVGSRPHVHGRTTDRNNAHRTNNQGGRYDEEEKVEITDAILESTNSNDPSSIPSVSVHIPTEHATILHSQTPIYDETETLNNAAIQAALEQDLRLLANKRNSGVSEEDTVNAWYQANNTTRLQEHGRVHHNNDVYQEATVVLDDSNAGEDAQFYPYTTVVTGVTIEDTEDDQAYPSLNHQATTATSRSHHNRQQQQQSSSISSSFPVASRDNQPVVFNSMHDTPMVAVSNERPNDRRDCYRSISFGRTRRNERRTSNYLSHISNDDSFEQQVDSSTDVVAATNSSAIQSPPPLHIVTEAEYSPAISIILPPERATVLESAPCIYDDSDALNAAAIQAILEQDAAEEYYATRTQRQNAANNNANYEPEIFIDSIDNDLDLLDRKPAAVPINSYRNDATNVRDHHRNDIDTDITTAEIIDIHDQNDNYPNLQVLEVNNNAFVAHADLLRPATALPYAPQQNAVSNNEHYSFVSENENDFGLQRRRQENETRTDGPANNNFLEVNPYLNQSDDELLLSFLNSSLPAAIEVDQTEKDVWGGNEATLSWGVIQTSKGISECTDKVTNQCKPKISTEKAAATTEALKTNDAFDGIEDTKAEHIEENDRASWPDHIRTNKHSQDFEIRSVDVSIRYASSDLLNEHEQAYGDRTNDVNTSQRSKVGNSEISVNRLSATLKNSLELNGNHDATRQQPSTHTNNHTLTDPKIECAEVVAVHDEADIHPDDSSVEDNDYVQAELIGPEDLLDSNQFNTPNTQRTNTVASLTRSQRNDDNINAYNVNSPIALVENETSQTSENDNLSTDIMFARIYAYHSQPTTAVDSAARTAPVAEHETTAPIELSACSISSPPGAISPIKSLSPPHEFVPNDSIHSAEFVPSTNEGESSRSYQSRQKSQGRQTADAPGAQSASDSCVYDDGKSDFTQTPVPPRRSFQDTPSNEAKNDNSSGTSTSTQSLRGFSNIHSMSRNLAQSTSSVVGALLTDAKTLIRKNSTSSDVAAAHVLQRQQLPWDITPNLGMWIVTVQTNQKALERNLPLEISKGLKGFSVQSEKQGRCLGNAWAPPKMLSFSDFPFCHICKSKFALLRRACHCRNCGVCVCKDCTLVWPGKMIPETYNFKKEMSVNICRSCDWLSHSFRLALLDGDYDRSIALISTGNINLYSPFANVKGEMFYPVHCAVLGGNLDLLKYLVDENCCPVSLLRASGSANDPHKMYTPLLTSKGRSSLRIALENANVPIVQYLVVDKGLSIFAEKDVHVDILCRNLTDCLRMIPSGSAQFGSTFQNNSFGMFDQEAYNALFENEGKLPEAEDLEEQQDGVGARLQKNNSNSVVDDQGQVEGLNEECIICFDNTIDCVATPCGHQMCCLACSVRVSKCPVCSVECSFMRIYKS